METERLVTMANEIAAFFASSMDAGEAELAMSDHLRRFWEPRMRTALLAHLAAGGGGLSPVARAGASALRPVVARP